MITSLKKSWLLLLIALVVYVGLQWFSAFDWYRNLTGDPKAIGHALLSYPVLNFAVGLIGAFRHGFTPWRPPVTAALFLVPFFLFLDGWRQLEALPIFLIAYLVCGFLGEGVGVLSRKLLRGRTGAVVGEPGH